MPFGFFHELAAKIANNDMHEQLSGFVRHVPLTIKG